MNPMEQIPSGLILVEGQDDRHFLFHLCRSLPDQFLTPPQGDSSGPEITSKITGKSLKISERRGRENLLKALPHAVKTPERERIGAILDADQDPQETWDKAAEALAVEGVFLPAKPAPQGLILPGANQDQPTLGLWIMPDNQSPGELEDFALEMIPESDPTWLPAQEYINQLSEQQRKFNSDKIRKAQFYAWLATRKDPAHIGRALSANALKTGNPLCQAFLNWLHKLLQ